MGYRIKAHSSREQLELFDEDQSIPDELRTCEEQKYTFRVCIKLYKGRNLAATLYGIVFDEKTIEKDGEDIQDVADMIDDDVEGAMANLMASKVFKQELDEDLAFVPLYDCYIQNYFITPKFENSGIEKYLFKNLYDIFLYCFNTHIRCFVTCPAPQQEDKDGSWVDISDADGSIKNSLIEFHKQMGYKALRKIWVLCN